MQTSVLLQFAACTRNAELFRAPLHPDPEVRCARCMGTASYSWKSINGGECLRLKDRS